MYLQLMVALLFSCYCQGSAFVETGTVKTVGLTQAFAF
jgi:hypothetical protein